MGTRADFYIGRGKDAEWIGSIAYDGYPDGEPEGLLNITVESGFRLSVKKLIEGCNHGTKPEQGWPWPWEDSQLTDYSYAFDNGKVWASCFGYPWFDPLYPESDERNEEIERPIFPDMSDRQNVTLWKRSGLLVFTA